MRRLPPGRGPDRRVHRAAGLGAGTRIAGPGAVAQVQLASVMGSKALLVIDGKTAAPWRWAKAARRRDGCFHCSEAPWPRCERGRRATDHLAPGRRAGERGGHSRRTQATAAPAMPRWCSAPAPAGTSLPAAAPSTAAGVSPSWSTPAPPLVAIPQAEADPASRLDLAQRPTRPEPQTANGTVAGGAPHHAAVQVRLGEVEPRPGASGGDAVAHAATSCWATVFSRASRCGATMT